MSGTFNEIDVPPTLVSFAVDTAKEQEIITPELKRIGSYLVQFSIARDEYDKPDYAQIQNLYDTAALQIAEKSIISAYALDANGVVPAISKMAFGNKIGVTLEDGVSLEQLFAPAFGNIVAEVAENQFVHFMDSIRRAGLEKYVTVLGRTNGYQQFIYGETQIAIDDALKVWKTPLEHVYPTRSSQTRTEIETGVYHADSIYICKHKVAKPTVFIPVFPGTNCEYDSAKAFERAGANVITKVFKNLTAADIRESVDVFKKAIGQSQIIMFPGGFSAGDEPEGSAKFFATAFRNESLKEAVDHLLHQRDGLALGICNGFQALIKLGLVPYGEIRTQSADSPTLTYNTIGRHISKMVYTKVVSDKSPWLAKAELGKTYTNPASHGEGRFVAPKEWLDKLLENGQIATQYVNETGTPTMDEEWNVNGSYLAVEGITSPDGRVLGKMAHSERRGDGVAINIYGKQDLKLFEAGVEYFK
jgi:phosphoribosylformylglycinamidine synthase